LNDLNKAKRFDLRLERFELLNDLTVGFGSLARVLEPASLLKEIKGDLTKSLRSYGP